MQQTKEVDPLEVEHAVSMDEFIAMAPEEQRIYIARLAGHEAGRLGWMVTK